LFDGTKLIKKNDINRITYKLINNLDVNSFLIK